MLLLDSRSYDLPLAANAPLNRGLLGWWRASGVGNKGYFRDLMNRSGRIGTDVPLINAATWVAGRSASTRALRCDGSERGARITCPTYLRLARPLHISGWLRSNGTSPSNYAGLFGISYTNYDSVPYESFTLGNSDAGYLRGYSNNSGLVWLNASSYAISSFTNWTHVAFEVSGTNGYIYVNGIQVASGYSSGSSFADPTYGTAQLTIGASTPGTSRNINCDIDDVRIANRYYGEDGIKQLYHASRRGWQQELARPRRYWFPAASSAINADLPTAVIRFTPVAPTASKGATAGQGLVDLLPVAPTTTKAATAGQGLIDLTGIAATANFLPAAGQGLIDLAPVVATTTKAAASGQGLIDFTPPAPTANFLATSGQGLVDFVGVSPTSSKAAAAGIGLVDFVGAAPVDGIQAQSGQGLIDLVGVAPTNTKAATAGQGLVDFVGVSPAAAKAATAGQGMVDLLAVAPTSTKAAALPIAAVDFVAPSLDGGQSANLPAGLVDFTPVTPVSTKAATAGQGLIDFTPLSSTASHAAAAGVGLLDLLSIAPGSSKAVASGQGLIDIFGQAPTNAIAAVSGIGLLELSAVAPTTSKQVLHGIGLIEFLTPGYSDVRVGVFAWDAFDYFVPGVYVAQEFVPGLIVADDFTGE